MGKKKSMKEMSFLDHLEELRWLLIRSTIAILAGGCVAYYYSDFIFDSVIFGPKDGNFVTYRFFCELAQKYDLDQSFCMTELPFELQNRTMEGQFAMLIWTSITVGFILAFPFILWELWKFISPALYEKEKRNARYFIFVSSLLFFLGVMFGYFVITPLSINFLANLTISKFVVNSIDIQSYIGLVKSTSLSTGLVFELPIVIYFLSRLGIVSPSFLRTYRKYAYVIILIIAAIVTPPDVISQMIVTIPLVILYELSIFISKFVVKKQELKNT
ncbi:twin-arginine translocase subunit TatC [Flavobacterium sp. WV_118_3]|jgi:sec-independent protein translocase protein TatC|uniref:twin-arginine translocase subunit TatC n=1 Tax=Flavobacterium sp. WV_118_3 TaxID=3151764 RepID=UPI002BD91366|nr:twin-arginine translocase subunit TatC [Flavobacterium sp.]